MKFKIGDVVMIHDSSVHGRNAGKLTGPFTIEKIHKGNGNLMVDGRQFDPRGSWYDKRDQWSTRRAELLLHGSPEFAAVQAKIRTANLRSACADLMQRVSLREATDEQLCALFDALHALRGEAGKVQP